jgi:hypothetical protein
LPGALPQHRIPYLYDFNFHGIRDFRMQASALQALLNLISTFEDIREESRCKMKSSTCGDRQPFFRECP